MSILGNVQLIKKMNIQLVLEEILESSEITRAQIAKRTGLNKATVSTAVQYLIDKKLIREEKLVRSGGRPGTAIQFDFKIGMIIALEINYDFLYFYMTDLSGSVLEQEKVEIANEMDVNDFCSKKIEAYYEKYNNSSVYGVIGIGIGIHGIVDHNENVVFTPYVFMEDLVFIDELKKKYTGLLYVDNESNLIAIGNRKLYFKNQNQININIHTGVGSGIIINHQLYKGELGYAGEIGHMIVEKNGKACPCGNRGCLEQYISTPAMVKAYHFMTNKKVDFESLVTGIKHKQQDATKIYSDFIDYLSIAINNISITLNPQLIVINSSFISKFPEIISKIEQQLISKVSHTKIISINEFNRLSIVQGICDSLMNRWLNEGAWIKDIT